MAEKGLILPDAPLFMVDKSLREQQSSKSTSTLASSSFSIDNIKVTTAGGSQGNQITQTFPGQYTSSTSTKASDRHGFQFVAATEPGGRQNRDARRLVRQQARKYEQRSRNQAKNRRPRNDVETTEFVSPDTDVDELEVAMAAKLIITSHIPGSSTVLYGQPSDQEPTGLEQFLHYYRCVIARSCNPLERHLSLGIDPVKKSCFPLVLSDRLFLQTVLLVSAVHYSCVLLKGQEPIGTNALAHRVVKELRRRIAERDVADTTLLSVSCIAIIENMLGHHDQWNIHNSGIRQMVSVRGGVQTIDAAIRWKLYRADLVGAIDSMGKPLLPRPPEENIPKMIDAEIEEMPDPLFDNLFVHSGVSSLVQSTFCDIRLVVNTIRHGIANDMSLEFIAFDSHCTRIKFNLLQAETGNALDESCKIAGLSFTSTLTMLYPFLGTKCIVVSRRLRLLFQQIPTKPTNEKLYLWLGFMGAFVSANTDDYPWFVQFLKPLVHKSQCTTWNDAQEMLSEVLWLRPFHQEPGRKVWQDASNTKMEAVTA